jgi:hypothetical protein
VLFKESEGMKSSFFKEVVAVKKYNLPLLVPVTTGIKTIRRNDIEL